MKNGRMTMAMAFLMPMALLAAPAIKLDPVAEKFPVWTGVTDKNLVCGRELCPSDLRHKITIVIEVEPNDKLQDQLIAAGPLLSKTGIAAGFAETWEDRVVPRHAIVLVSNRGKRNPEAFKTATTPKKGDKNGTVLAGYVNGFGASIYNDVTFEGAPDSTGKRPFLYVMGPTGKEPICQGPLNDATIKEANAAIAKAKKEMSGWDPAWQPFFGTVPADKIPPAYAKALEKGRSGKMSPLDPIAKGLLKGILSKDEATSTEAQILFDAINQTRSDLVMRITMEASACPHRAYYDIQELLRYWPMEKKRVEAAYAKIKTNPDVEPIAKVFCKVMEWAKPDFVCKNANEVKKNIAELNKMKKTVAAAKESKNITVQNAALIVDMKIDELIASMPSKVPVK